MTFEFKIKIEDSSKPPIWRKLKMDASHSFMQLHWAIQGAFEWYNAHLFRFTPQGRGSVPSIELDIKEDIWMENEFAPPKTWPHGERYKADEIRLGDYYTTPGQKMIYTYDFGDDWHHSIVLEAVDEGESLIFPVCTAGKGQAPVEDCGGIWGYYHMVEAVNDRKHPEHAHWRKWLELKKGESWDVKYFDLQETQNRLAEVWRVMMGKK